MSDSQEAGHTILQQPRLGPTEGETCSSDRPCGSKSVLHSPQAKSVHVKANTSHKLEAVRQKLGLTESEAKVFVAVSASGTHIQRMHARDMS